MKAPESGPYHLSDDENAQIFYEQIVPDLLADIPSQHTPTLSVVVGQHGAGKTHLTDTFIKPDLQERGGYIDIDTDIYKRYHPAYEELMALDDKSMAAHTGPDGQRWMLRAYNYAREHRKNTLTQETVQNPPFLASMIKAYCEDEFRVEITAMGVSEAVSRQGVIKRYHEQVSLTGSGRLPPSEKIRASLVGILKFAAMTDEEMLADSVAVYRRNSSHPSYSNTILNNAWRQAPRFREAIEEARNSPLEDEEAEEFLLTHARLMKSLGKEWEFELYAIESIARHILRPPVEMEA